jgi:hypothetical protein
LRQVEQAKKAVSMPVIASLNGILASFCSIALELRAATDSWPDENRRTRRDLIRRRCTGSLHGSFEIGEAVRFDQVFVRAGRRGLVDRIAIAAPAQHNDPQAGVDCAQAGLSSSRSLAFGVKISNNSESSSTSSSEHVMQIHSCTFGEAG